MNERMVEKMAKAIYSAQHREVYSDVEPRWGVCRNEARAALQALREPTPEMVEAMRSEMFTSDGRLSDAEELEWMSRAFTAAIDADLRTELETTE